VLLIDLFDRGRLLNPDGICLVDLPRDEMKVTWRDAASHTHRIARPSFAMQGSEPVTRSAYFHPTTRSRS
jgi:hypothetical protein